MNERFDAVVIGAGPNGLVAANALVDAGWDVLLVEAQPQVGGAVRSREWVPGYVSDMFSSFYPLGAVSPAFEQFELHNHGLRWTRAPNPLAHPRHAADEDAPVIYDKVEDTVAALARHDKRDADTWLRLCEQWQVVRKPLLDTLFTTFPPVRGPWGMISSMGVAESARFLRLLALPMSTLGRELFRSEAARLLLMGNALHADVPLGAPVSGAAGYLLAMLAQDVGFPVPVGGAGQLSEALARRFRAKGGQIRCGSRVEGIVVRGGRARGVRIAGGEEVRASRAVVADVTAPSLYGDLLPAESVPPLMRADIDRFDWDTPVVKVNYAVAGAIPWRSPILGTVGTLHLGGDEDKLAGWMSDLDRGHIPEHPFVLFGQMSTTDRTRSAPGTESAWAYTHLPRGKGDRETAQRIADMTTAVIEAHAPGFTDLVERPVIQYPSDLQSENENLRAGAVNAGTAQLHQQYVFRPTLGLADSLTPVQGLFLGSASAHPGGGVHGMCGMLAARAALRQNTPGSALRRGAHRLLNGQRNEGATRAALASDAASAT